MERPLLDHSLLRRKVRLWAKGADNAKGERRKLMDAGAKAGSPFYSTPTNSTSNTSPELGAIAPPPAPLVP